MRSRVLLLVFAALLLCHPFSALAEEKKDAPLNGFDVSKHVVPKDQIIEGGPARDRIRSVDEPEWVKPLTRDLAHWVHGDSPVMGVVHRGVPRALPIHVMEFHQVVNDVVDGDPVVHSFDPLAGTPRSFLATVDGKKLEFGVSGLIYNCNFLMYDRQTESLWSQFTGRAIAGPLAGKQLSMLRVRQEPWGVWLGREANTTILARPMPEEIDYRRSPYSGYWVSEKIPFPVLAEDDRYHPKEVVLGVQKGGVARAYLGSILTAAGGRIVDEIDDATIRIAYEGDVANFIYEAPESVEVTDAYWFAWKAFHPDTEIWKGGGEATSGSP